MHELSKIAHDLTSKGLLCNKACILAFKGDSCPYSATLRAQGMGHTSPLSVPVARYPASIANVVVPDTDRDLGEALTTSNACKVEASLQDPREPSH